MRARQELRRPAPPARQANRTPKPALSLSAVEAAKLALLKMVELSDATPELSKVKREPGKVTSFRNGAKGTLVYGGEQTHWSRADSLFFNRKTEIVNAAKPHLPEGSRISVVPMGNVFRIEVTSASRFSEPRRPTRRPLRGAGYICPG